MRRLAPLILIAMLACARGSDPGGLGLRRVSTPMPVVSGDTVQGGSVGPQDYRGKVVVLNVWATWCGPCRREQPALQRLWDRFRGEGVYFLGINYRDDAAAARAWVDEFGVTYPSVEDPSGTSAADLGFPGLPDTYVVDRSGTIRYAVIGEIDEDEVARLIQRVVGSRS